MFAEVAGAEHARIFGALHRREAALERGKQRVIAGDEARGARPRPVALDRRDRRRLDRRMARQAEIVVAGEREQPPSAARDERGVLARGVGQRAAQRAALQRVELVLRVSVERQHRPFSGAAALEMSKLAA